MMHCHHWYAAPMPRALVLNASFEPLSVVPARRALVLVLRERAEVVASNGFVWHSEQLTVPSPTVVRLHNFVRVPYNRRVPLNRRSVFLRDNHECQYCGRAAENIDHVVPKTQGGLHNWTNVVAACRRCNSKKGGRTPTEAGFRLRRRPETPRRNTWVVVANGTRMDPTWEPYLKAG